MTGLNLDTIECADVMDYLRGLPDACVNLVVTSPPYFGLRSYLEDGHADKAREIGTEQTPAAYVARMVDVFREVKRVLRSDGNVYVNLGDSYNSGTHWSGGGPNASAGNTIRVSSGRTQAMFDALPPKSLMLIPHRFAIAMQDDGWLLREDIVWQKPNPMPESVRDRCTRSHEYIFHFTKGPRYWYDAQAVAEPTSEGTNERGKYPFQPYNNPGVKLASSRGDSGGGYAVPANGLRNRRSVWTINPANFREAHFATFPEDIPEICIKAACPEWCCDQCGAPYEAQVERENNWESCKANGATGGTLTNGHNTTHGRGMSHDLGTGAVRHNGYAPSCTCNAGKRAGVVMDIFMGAGTVGLVAKKLNRRYIGCDLNAEYVRMAEDRINGISYTLFSLMEVTGD
jgi:DNA modification methylase